MKRKEILVLLLIITAIILIAGCTPTTSTTAIIEVNSTPSGARIYLDGVDTGMATPFTITNVEASSHIVKLDLFHYKIWQETVIVTANETNYFNPLLIYAPEETRTLQPGPEGIDSAVSSISSTTNFGGINYCVVGNAADLPPPITQIVRTYIKFDLSTVPADAMVVNADLKLYQWDTYGTANFTIGLHNVTSDWEEDTIDWDSQPTSSVDLIITSNITAGATTWKSWDIDDLVQAWLDGNITNYGTVLKDTDETSVNTKAYFWTSDYITDPNKYPKLEIDYYIP